MSLFWKEWGETVFLWWTGWGFVCVEMVQSDYLLQASRDVSALHSMAQLSSMIRVQSLHKGWATCSRAQKYTYCNISFVSFTVSVLSQDAAWLTFSITISDSFVQMRTMMLMLHAFETVLKMSSFWLLVSIFWISPFPQFLVSVSLGTEDFNCCYLSMFHSMKEQCLGALVVLWGWWVLCLSKQISQ